MNASRLVAVALLAFACSRPVDVERQRQAEAVTNVLFHAKMTLSLCQTGHEKACDRTKYDAAFRELQDSVLSDSKRKAAVEKFGVAFEHAIRDVSLHIGGETPLAYEARQAANEEMLTLASIRLDAAMRGS